MTQLHEEENDQRQPARQHLANRLRYPAGIASVNDERDGERHLAVSSHPLGIPVTGSLPPPPPFCNHRRRERTPVDPFRTLPACLPLPLTPHIAFTVYFHTQCILRKHAFIRKYPAYWTGSTVIFLAFTISPLSSRVNPKDRRPMKPVLCISFSECTKWVSLTCLN